MLNKHTLAFSPACLLLCVCSSVAQERGLKSGQMWTYKDSDTADSRVTILAVEDDQDVGTIVLVRIDGLDVGIGQLGSEGLPVLGLTRTGLERSVLDHVDTIDVSDQGPQINQWREVNGTISIGTVAEAVARMKRAFALTNELLELRGLITPKLPAYLPKPDPTPKAFPESEAIKVLVVCDEPGTRTEDGLVGHKVHWEVDGAPFHEQDELLEELKKRAGERIPNPDDPQSEIQRPVMVTPGPEVVFGDVAEILDLLISAGFDNIRFGEPTKKQ